MEANVKFFHRRSPLRECFTVRRVMLLFKSSQPMFPSSRESDHLGAGRLLMFDEFFLEVFDISFKVFSCPKLQSKVFGG